MYSKEEQQEINNWNSQVERKCKSHGTYEGIDWGWSDREFVIEVECYRADDSADGFYGFWKDDHSQITHADTPYEVYLDLP